MLTRRVPGLPRPHWRAFSSPSRANPATVLSSPPTSAGAPTAPLRPQPFIPKPLSRTPQIKTLEASSISTTKITFETPTHPIITLEIPNLFLRDSTRHPSHVHPASQQKLFRTSDIPAGGKLLGYGVHEVAGEDCLVTEWDLPIAGVQKATSKLSVVPVRLLVEILDNKQDHLADLPLPNLWDKRILTPILSKTPYSQYLSDDETLRRSLESLLQTGIAFLEKVPTDVKEGHETELKKLVERIGSLRRTWYGDLWDVKAEEGSKNIAYTNLDLGLHMDLVHFASPPRYQFLHSLLNTSISGGSSYFVDTYHIISLLRASHPSAYATLCTSPLTFSYKSDSHHTRFTRPTIELSPLPPHEVIAVNYSPPFQGALPLNSTSNAGPDALEKLHEALSLFAKLADDPENQFHAQLEPGDCVVFDNRRVLHARTAFDFVKAGEGDAETKGERGRWLKGAYMDGDEVQSRWRVLREKGKTF
ncbi:hypothetical protein P7C70_g4390, partial [Phenoliferia sp. Uapishka_3]